MKNEEVLEQKQVFAQGVCLKKIFWIFLVGCVFGCLIEMINHYISHGDWVSRKGLIYGPLNPVYGFGAVIFTVFLVRIKNPVWIFVGGMLLGGGFEYLCSFIQEHVFGTISWDYSHKPFNIGGRTTLSYMFIWGVLALIFVKGIYPFISNLLEKMPIKIGNILTICLLIFLIIDAIISITACLRYKERQENIPPSNNVEVFLDKHYPDNRIDEIFENSTFEKIKS